MEYPSEYELDIVLRDGVVARCRPIRPSDAKSLVDMFQRLGIQSRYFRFFRAKERLTDEEVEFFTNVDYESRMAVVILYEDEMIGVGRYDRELDDPSKAEVAFAVADDQQGRGIGTQLLQILTTYARFRMLLRWPTILDFPKKHLKFKCCMGWRTLKRLGSFDEIIGFAFTCLTAS